MKWLRALPIALSLALVGAGCGGGDDSDEVAAGAGSATPSAGAASDGTPDGSGDGGTATKGISDPAPVGEVIVEVGDETYSSTISDCLVGENGSFTVVARPGPFQISIAANPVGSDWMLGVSGNGDDGLSFGGQVRGDEPAVDGASIEFTTELAQMRPQYGDMGEARVRATCPPVASPTNPGGPADLNTIQIGNRVWTRSTAAMASDCYLEKQSDGAEIAGVSDALDGDESKRFGIRFGPGVAEAHLDALLYEWDAGPSNPSVNDLAIELHFETSTIRGSGTFYNELDGTSAQGYFTFVCEG